MGTGLAESPLGLQTNRRLQPKVVRKPGLRATISLGLQTIIGSHFFSLGLVELVPPKFACSAYFAVRPKAVLKPRALQTLRDCRTFPNHAQRLDCGAFTAAFPGARSQRTGMYAPIFANAIKDAGERRPWRARLRVELAKAQNILPPLI